MPKVMTSRQFNQDTGSAKRATKDGPVFITDRGETSHVLLSIGEYRKLAGKGMSLYDALADPRPEADFDFEIERIKDFSFKPAEFD